MDGPREMTKIAKQFRTGLFNFVIIAVIASAMASEVACQGYKADQTNGTYFGNLVLNIFIDEAGKALVTGYADNIEGLPFLISSQYKYDKNTKQIYALTNSLTYKSGDDWQLKIPLTGNYSEYHSIFYLPPSAKISQIESSPGLEYLVSASNDSFQVDLHGYDVKNPIAIIDYQLLPEEIEMPSRSNANTMIPIVAVLGLSLAFAALILVMKRRSAKPSSKASHQYEDSKCQTIQPIDQVNEVVTEVDNDSQIFDEIKQSGYQDYFVAVDDLLVEMTAKGIPAGLSGGLIEVDRGSEAFEVKAEIYEANGGNPKNDESFEGNIKITSEMSAVMETLTNRERAILTALIEHKGVMTQADIRYETRIPKSSLTGIILSLERRKLINKKEEGKTNVIRLCKWFLSKRGPS